MSVIVEANDKGWLVVTKASCEYVNLLGKELEVAFSNRLYTFAIEINVSYMFVCVIYRTQLSHIESKTSKEVRKVCAKNVCIFWVPISSGRLQEDVHHFQAPGGI